MDYIDVSNISELPVPPAGMRYFDFIGGEKEVRCFLAPENMSRGTFMDENKSLLGEALQPIYEHNGVLVSQDTSCPLPGFYIVSPTQHFRSMDKVGEDIHLRLAFIMRHVRKAMREVLGIEYVHVLYEEKAKKGCHVHYWMMPIVDIEKNPRLDDIDINAYMQSFSYKENKDKICEFNTKMREHFKELNLKCLDDNLLKSLLEYHR